MLKISKEVYNNKYVVALLFYLFMGLSSFIPFVGLHYFLMFDFIDKPLKILWAFPVFMFYTAVCGLGTMYFAFRSVKLM